MIIILDTNIWLGELGLNSSLGAAVRFYLRQQNARLALPEVVRLEVEHNFRQKIKQYVSDVRENHRQLLAVFGRLKEVVLPDDGEVENKIAEIFSGVGVDILNIEFTLESAKSSFLKTIHKVPPSDQKQQFKDGVLWADCVSLLEHDEVLFVTTDTAFYNNRKYDEGLAKNLLTEIAGKPHSLKIFRSLAELMVQIKVCVTLDDHGLVSAFTDKYKQYIDPMLERSLFTITENYQIEKTLYATEDPRVLHVNFSIDIQCCDVSDEQRSSSVLHLSGNGCYNVETGFYSDLNINEQKLNYINADGTKGESANMIFAVGNIVIGHKDIIHSVRYRITEEGR